MPAKLDRCVKALQEKGYTEQQSYAICNASISDGTYAAMKVKNKDQFYDWFESQGVKVVPKDELHTTVSFSRKPYVHLPDISGIKVRNGSIIEIAPLGDDGAIVLKFESEALKERHQKAIDSGATWDYPEYIPHITITYEGDGVDISSLKKPDFDIELEEEYVQPLDLDWKEKLTDRKMLTDKAMPALDKYIDQTSGFLHVKGRLARTGVQEYLGRELSPELEPDKMYGVLRHPDDVLDPKSVEGFRNAPVTDNHPDDFVTSENYKDLMKGSCSEPTPSKKDGIDYIDGQLTVMDKDLVSKLKDGKLEISAGYYSDLEEEQGEYLGVPYHFRQKNIQPNHVAIVSRGRCGGSCRIINDYATITDENQNKGESMAIIKIGETEYDVPEEVAAKLAELQEALSGKEEEVETMSEDMAETEKEKEAAVAMADELKEQVKTLKRTTRDSVVAGEAKKIVEVMKVADSMGIACEIKDEIAMKTDVLKAKYPSIDLSGKSKDYITARFDAMVEGRKAAEVSHKKIGDEAQEENLHDKKLADSIKDEEY